MIQVSEAHKLIQDSTSIAQKEIVSVAISNKRILAEDIFATRNQPPFNRVAMDGIAIDSKSVELEFNIEGVQAAGAKQLSLSSSENCIEVMTGATLPLGCDCVIPYEKTTIDQDKKTAKIEKSSIALMKNIHSEASDYKEGEIVLKKGTMITSPVCAIIASQGKSEVSVYKTPKVIIISTGSELVELDKPIEPYQIYMSNSYAIESELKSYGLTDIARLHIPDNPEETQRQIKHALENYDILILTGGVSRGKFDYIPGTLDKLGVKKLFHKIKQKPGKPMWYGSFENKQIFALPGNPVSCLVCLRRYVIPALDQSLGKNVTPHYGELQSTIEFKRDFTLFASVSATSFTDGRLLLFPISSNGSGDFYAIGQSTGFIELPPEPKIFKPGEIFQYYSWQT